MIGPGVSIVLWSTKNVENVAGAYRAAACLGASRLVLLEPRCDREVMVGEITKKHRDGVKRRLRREFRLHSYRDRVDLITAPASWLEPDNIGHNTRVIGVELVPGAIDLVEFDHPYGSAVYLFGPEDGSIPQALRRRCHQFVQVPMSGPGLCLNLAATVNVLLYSRLAGERRCVS